MPYAEWGKPEPRVAEGCWKKAQGLCHFCEETEMFYILIVRVGVKFYTCVTADQVMHLKLVNLLHVIYISVRMTFFFPFYSCSCSIWKFPG